MTEIDNRRPSTDGQLNLPLVAVGLTIFTPDAIDKLTSAKLQGLQPCPSCGCKDRLIGPGVNMHAASLTCMDCGRYLKWIKKTDLPVLTAIARANGGDSNG